MLNTLSFVMVNVLLTIMLIQNKKNKQSIDSLFLACLGFSVSGNLAIGISINTILSLINLIIGINLFKINKEKL